jgi:hypothetical protein
MRHGTAIVLVLAALAGWPAAGPQLEPGVAADDPPGTRRAADSQPRDERPPEPSTLQAFMRLKLAHAQDVLEGLATEDFGKISRGAQKLRALAVDASWNVYETEEYALYSREFIDAARQMGASAREKNIDAAALAYVQLTLTCVQCHKHVRDVRTARLDGGLLWPAIPRRSG